MHRERTGWLCLPVLASLSSPKALAAATPERPPPTSTPDLRCARLPPRTPRTPGCPMPTRRRPVAPPALHAWLHTASAHGNGCRCCWHGVGMAWQAWLLVSHCYATGAPSIFCSGSWRHMCYSCASCPGDPLRPSLFLLYVCVCVLYNRYRTLTVTQHLVHCNTQSVWPMRVVSEAIRQG